MPGSMASQVMGWQRRMGAVASPFAATGESGNGNPIQIEMYINGAWVDITSYVMVRDNSGNISITRGRRDEGSSVDQGSCQMTLNNRDGRWSPRNVTGTYYGYIGRNQPVRISVPDGFGGKSYRFRGEISSWPQSWDPTGTDIWTEVEGSGIIRRLSQAPPPSESLMYVGMTSPYPVGLRAYWPMEDAAEAASLASALVSGSSMSYTGTPTLADYDGFPSSDPVPTLVSSVLSGGVAKYTDPSSTQVRFFCNIPSDGLLNGTVLCAIDQEDYSAGSVQFWEIYYGNFGGTGHGLTLHSCASDGTDLGADLENTYDVRGKKLYISIEFSESGTSITRALRIYDLTSGISFDVNDTLASAQLTRVTKVQFGPATRSVASPSTGSTGLSSVHIGHVSVEDVITPIGNIGVALNPTGEKAGRRIQRSAAEAGIAFESIGDLDDTVAMGNAVRNNALTTMQECETADGGMLYEMTAAAGMGYRTRASLLNQDAQLTLNYAGFNLSEVPTPVEDDRYIQNKVTVTIGSVSETYELTAGSLSTQQPPAGVGEYGNEVTLNLQDEGEAESQAAWRVFLGTVDEPRYPQISVNLAHSSFTSNPALKQAVLGLRQGDRILVQNPPSWLPPGDIDQIVLGFEERITHFEHQITFTCQPASPYNAVSNVDNPNARIDTDGSELTAALTTTDTALGVKPTDPYEVLWTKSASDLPLDIRVGGEVMRVTSIADLVTDTFTRTESNGWGTNDTGFTWSTGGGTAADYSVSGGKGNHTLATAAASRRCFLGTTISDFDAYVSVTSDQLATGNYIAGGLTFRYLDADNLYNAQVMFTTTNTVTALILKRVGAVETLLGSYTLPNETFVAGTYYRLRFKIKGTSLKCKAWAATDAETPVWQVSVSDNDLVASTLLGFRSISGTGNTNVNPTVSYDDYGIVSPQYFTVTRSINGVVKAHSTGEDVRLAYPTYIGP